MLTLAAPLVMVLGAPLWVPVMAVYWLRARASVRRFFAMLRGATGGFVTIRARRFLVVDVRPSRRDEPASALLLHLPFPDAAAPSKASASSALGWPRQGESLEPFLVHLTKEQLENAAFIDQVERSSATRWSLWMDCALPMPTPTPTIACGTIAALAAARARSASSSPLPLFSNARTATRTHKKGRPILRLFRSTPLHCEADVDMFLVGRAPWLSALVLPHDIAARRIQRSWRKAIGDPSMQLCRRRLLDEARELENLFSRQGRGRAPPLDRAKA